MRQKIGVGSLGIALAALALLGGCALQRGPVEPNPMTVTGAEFDAVFHACREALRERYFEEDRIDRRAGVITTAPSTAGGIGEFWRRDRADAEGIALASLGAVRKIVSIQIKPTKTGGFTVALTVVTQRRQLPNLEPTTTSDAYSIFRTEKSLLGERLNMEARQMSWERERIAWWADLGRDEALEQALLRDVKKALAAAPS